MARKKAITRVITLEEHLAGIRGKGGKASMQNRTEEERSEFARAGGQVGGKRRAETLAPRQRSAIAAAAAKARWDAYYAAHPEKVKAKARRAKEA